MENLPTENILDINPQTKKSDSIQKDEGDNYPIILYEPDINCHEKKNLKKFVGENSSIHSFAELNEALKFTQSLGVSFILIVPKLLEEKTVINDFRGSEDTYGCAMFDFEEEDLFKDLFVGISDDLIKSLDIKAYVFITLLDLINEDSGKADEEEIMLICDVKDLAKEFRQEFVIILYDPLICPAAKERLKQQFDIEERNIYTSFEEFEKRIQNPNNSPYHLIMTGKIEAEKVISEIDKIKEMLLCLYIYCDDPEIIQKGKRIIFVEETVEKLIPKITEGIRTKSKLTNSFPSFVTDFDAFDKTDIYNLHYYLQSLINFQNRNQAKGDFLRLSNRIYQSKKLIEFEKDYSDYSQKDILKWYIAESPVYKLVNNCLRIATPNSILYCRYILKDLERAIREDFKGKGHKYSGVVYRGTYISEDEWEKLQRNVGKGIEMYGFLSTSLDKEIAKNFLFSDLQKKIFITIIIPPLPAPELNEQGFANISPDSNFNEAEILFNVRSKFRILEARVTKINHKGKDVECRHLVLMYGAELLRKYMTEHKPVINVNLKLPHAKICGLCGSTQELFAFNQGVIEIRCLDCLRKDQVPQNIPLLSLDLENNIEGDELIVKSFKGQVLSYNQATDLSYFGYKCVSCQGSGEVKYYKWINLVTKKTFEQCSNCFKNKREIGCHVLLAEKSPYVLWQEHQAEWETIDTNHQAKVSETVKEKSQAEVFMDVHQFDLCIAFEKKVLSSLKRKRRREMRKFKSFLTIGEANAKDGKHKEALRYLIRAQEITRTFSLDKHSDIGVLFTNLGSVYQDLGQPQEALSCFTEGLKLNKTLHGNLHQETAISYNNLALFYDNIGKYQEALEYSVESLKITKFLYGKKHPETADAYYNLGGIFTDLGQQKKGLRYLTKALHIVKAIFGDKHPRTLTCYGGASRVFQDLGQYQEAFEHRKKVLSLSKALYGDKHFQTVELYIDLAPIYERLGKYQEAHESLTKALDLTNKLDEDKHPNTEILYNRIAQVYATLGEDHKALQYLTRALDLAKSMFGEINSKTASLYHLIALRQNSLGQGPKALESMAKALDILKTLYGDNHPKIIVPYQEFAVIHSNMKQNKKALEYSINAFNLTKRIFGENNTKTATSYHNLALIFSHLEKHEKALEYLTKAVDLLKAICGDNHPEIIDPYQELAVMHVNRGQYQGALEYSIKAFDLTKRIFGENHAKTATSYHNLALIYSHMGQHAKALEASTKALGLVKGIFGDSHLETAQSYREIARVYQSSGKYKKSLQYSTKALDLTKRVFGENHPETAQSYREIAEVYQNSGEYQKALQYSTKTLDLTKSLFGDHNINTVFSYHLLTSIQDNLGQRQNVFESATKTLEIMEDMFGAEFMSGIQEEAKKRIQSST